MTHKTVPIEVTANIELIHASGIKEVLYGHKINNEQRKLLISMFPVHSLTPPPDNTVQELREQVAELQKEAAWVRNKLGIPVDSGFLTGEVTLAGKMHNMVAHAKGYEKYVVTGKCDDKSGEIARQSVHIDTLEQQNLNLLALVEKKNDALMLQASHMEMYSLQISHANDYAKITRAIDLEPEDVELVEVNHVDYVEVDPAHYDVVSTLDDGTKLYKIKMKGK